MSTDGMSDISEKFLFEKLSSIAAKNNLDQTARALVYALKLHHGQKRAEGTPYIIHPLTMAYHAYSIGINEDNIIAAMLLHDVCEDCGVSADELPVNECVKNAVSRLTIRKHTAEQRTAAKIEYFEKIRDCREACITKLFDRCNNVSTMAVGFNEKKLQRYIKETYKYVYPLMDYTLNKWPEFEKQIFAIRYQMESIMSSIDAVRKTISDNDKIAVSGLKKD